MSAPPLPSGEGVRAVPPLRLVLLVLGLLAIRLALAAGVHLTEDEAYYRLWAQAPALGYFDHPPMIAWWIWLGRQVAGDTPLAVRLLPSLGCAAISFLVWDLAGRLGADGATAQRSAVWYNATLLVAAGGFLAVPDAPAALFWMACLCAAQRAFARRSTAWWLAAGAAAGLAALSKYSSLFLGPGMFLWLLASGEGRARLRTAGPWLALALAAAIFSLNVAWNGAHHWLTFAKQFGRIAPHRFEPRYLAEFVATQALLLNPLISVFLARGGKGAWRGMGLLWFTSAPFLGYLALHSLHDRVQAHWPAPVYPSMAMLAAASAALAAGPVWPRLRTLTPWVGLGLCAAGLVYFGLPTLGIPLRFDPGGPVRGWPAFANRLESLRARTGAAWIGTTSYGLASQLLDERQVVAPVIQVSERDRWTNLPPEPVDLSRPGLVTDLARRVDPQRLARCFVQVAPLGAVVRGAPGERGARYVVFLVQGPRRDVLRDGC
jgi:4-amino-4-deoxy-L-arabinose transferase-like glycosyltransferase